MKSIVKSLPLVLLLVSPVANSAQEGRPTATPGAEPVKPVFVLHQTGVDRLLSDPRDAGLLRALSLLGPRLAELLEEYGTEPLPEGLVELVLDLGMAPKTIRFGLGEVASAEELVAASRGDLRFESASPEEARAWLARLHGLLAGAGLESAEAPGRPGVRRYDLEQTALELEARGEPDGSGSLSIRLGEPLAGEVDPGGFGLPAGAELRVGLRLDLGAMAPAIDLALESLGEEAQPVRHKLAALGIGGEHPYGIQFASGYDGERLHHSTRQVNWVPMARALDAFVIEPLSEADLRRVPADATLVSLSRANIAASFDALQVPGQPDPFALLTTLIGLDLRRDVIETLGETFGLYLSDTTGGGGVTSGVLFATVKERERLAASLRRIAELIQLMGMTQAQGRVTVRDWEHAGGACMTLVTPGLPVPLEPSLGFGGDAVFLALSPASLVAALDHAASGEAGLAGAPRFRDLAGDSLEGVQGVTFVDTPRMARDGYGMVSHLYSALANGLRASGPGAAELSDPGVLMPSFHEVLERCVPHVALARVSGNDLVLTGQGDSSVTANLAALFGGPLLDLAYWSALAGMGAAATVPQKLVSSAPDVPDVSGVEEGEED